MINFSKNAIINAVAQFCSQYSLRKLYIALVIFATASATAMTVMECVISNLNYANGLSWWASLAICWTVAFSLSFAYGIPMFAFLLVFYHVCEMLDPATSPSR